MKTAVELLQAEFNKWAEGKVFIPQDILEAAKEKEKEQLIKAHIDGFDNIVVDFKKQEFAEEYYNQTFKPETNNL